MTRRYEEFDFGDRIGVGTVGTIYRVVEKASGQLMALKLLSPAVSSDKNIVARFEREMLILSKLNHPNIVAYYGDGKHQDQLFYVMELINGGTLKEILQSSGTFTWQEAGECGRQIASALQHAHNHGIIHRDLKPGNVFLDESGESKLGDFGIARDMRAIDLTETGLTVGTYAYMAPELIRGNRDITGQVDLYALGCVLFEMLTGRPPYVGDNFAAIFDQHLSSDPPSLQAMGVNCPPEFDRLITSLLAKSPEDRPFNARSVQGILGELLSTSEPMAENLTSQDRAAAAVKPLQLRLQHLAKTQTPHERSWKIVGIVGLTVIVTVLIMSLLRDFF